MENTSSRPFSQYEKEVIRSYADLKDSGRLPAELERPSPAKLRDYCLWVLINRNPGQHDEWLRKYFDPGNKFHGDIAESIRKMDVDRLKPLINFEGVIGDRPRFLTDSSGGKIKAAASKVG